MSTPYASDSQSHRNRCNWCEGQQVRAYQWAYVPGADPFAFREIESATRVGPCRNCRGTGVYDPAGDPALEHLRRGV
jgi:hypothetical protein